MTTKETAENLIHKFGTIIADDIVDKKIIYGILTFNMSKNCAKLFCNEMLKELNTIDFDKQSEDYEFLTEYWNKVKLEIDSLKQ